MPYPALAFVSPFSVHEQFVKTTMSSLGVWRWVLVGDPLALAVIGELPPKIR